MFNFGKVPKIEPPVVVDDGSTEPRTIKLLDNCKENHTNVILHRLKTNKGLPNALNVGI